MRWRGPKILDAESAALQRYAQLMNAFRLKAATAKSAFAKAGELEVPHPI
jgi:hypothetical protein